MAQITGFLPPTWEAWIEFPPGLVSSLSFWASGGVSQHRSFCFFLFLSAFQINVVNKAKIMKGRIDVDKRKIGHTQSYVYQISFYNYKMFWKRNK